jgi:predicted nucleotidyltransferase component of viral defense system
MDTLRQHEIFEIEVLDKMKSAKVLDHLVFGGGTMLRLCHELSRYSIDLDFWFIKITYLFSDFLLSS